MSDTFDAAAHAAATETAAAPPPAESGSPAPDQNAEQSDQTAEDPDASEDTTPADPKDAPETPSRGEKRVQQLLAERHALREQLAYLQGVAQQGQQQHPAQAEPAKPAPLSGDLAQWVGEEPKPESFPAGEFDPQYLRAIARFEARNEQASLILAQRQHAARQAQDQQARAFMEAAEKATKEKPDFREVAGGLGQRLANWQADLLAHSGAEIVYAVGKDSEAEARIRAARNPVEAAREIGRIEARLERAKDPPSPQTTQAPEPAPRAVRGGNAGTRAPTDLPMGEYAAWRAKQTWTG
jgi:hypothetical protein